MADLMSAADAAAACAEAKAFLRAGHDGEDALIAQMVLAAAELCERFTGQALVARSFEEIVQASPSWVRLGQRPVRVIASVESLAPDGVAAALPVGAYAVDIDAAGEGWVRASTGGRVRVTYEAGLAQEWAGIPEALRQGVLKLAAHLFAQRGGGEAQPPAAVTALWRPWRAIPLGVARRAEVTACSIG